MLSLVRLKELLGIDEADRRLENNLQFILDDVQQNICSYCNLEEVPQGAEYVAYRMAVDIYRAEGFGKAEANADVTSIKEGDTQVNFQKASSEGTYAASLLKNYKLQLRRFRRLGRSQCSCIMRG